MKGLFLLAAIIFVASAVAAVYSLAEENAHLGGAARRSGVLANCNEDPGVCSRAGAGSHGKPACCRRRCVDLAADAHNCGRCGVRCKYPQVCCEGKCTDVTSGPDNCGACGNACPEGTECSHGMCSYA